MAVEIQLPERRAIGPTRVGRAKPGFDLAGGVGLQETGKAITEFASDVFEREISQQEKIEKSRAVNEEAEFHGIANTSIEAFDTYVADNPGASFEDLEKQKDKVITSIEEASQKATTDIAKENNELWMLQNKELLGQKLQTVMEARVSRQEKARFNVNTARAIRDMDPTELKSLYDNTELFTPENNQANFENDMSRLLERKVIEDARNAREAAALAEKMERLAKTAAKEKADIEFQEEYDDLTNMALGVPESPVIEPTIATQEEYDALPSGSYYTDANGNRGRKR